mmetsp:Transcript_9006/g.21390  ORF Transcript_9006/g.21390 Transcript_9006/m.21390 type:complete len:94 (+) Transcript_9006:1654-1935(+)
MCAVKKLVALATDTLSREDPQKDGTRGGDHSKSIDQPQGIQTMYFMVAARAGYRQASLQNPVKSFCFNPVQHYEDHGMNDGPDQHPPARNPMK